MLNRFGLQEQNQLIEAFNMTVSISLAMILVSVLIIARFSIDEDKHELFFAKMLQGGSHS